MEGGENNALGRPSLGAQLQQSSEQHEQRSSRQDLADVDVPQPNNYQTPRQKTTHSSPTVNISSNTIHSTQDNHHNPTSTLDPSSNPPHNIQGNYHPTYTVNSTSNLTHIPDNISRISSISRSISNLTDIIVPNSPADANREDYPELSPRYSISNYTSTPLPDPERRVSSCDELTDPSVPRIVKQYSKEITGDIVEDSARYNPPAYNNLDLLTPEKRPSPALQTKLTGLQPHRRPNSYHHQQRHQLSLEEGEDLYGQVDPVTTPRSLGADMGTGAGTGAGVGELSERIRLNVGGRLFDTCLATLGRIPDTRLSRLSLLGRFDASFDPARVEFFFDRNSSVFEDVLNYCRTGELHLNSSICGNIIKSVS